MCIRQGKCSLSICMKETLQPTQHSTKQRKIDMYTYIYVQDKIKTHNFSVWMTKTVRFLDSATTLWSFRPDYHSVTWQSAP